MANTIDVEVKLTDLDEFREILDKCENLELALKDIYHYRVRMRMHGREPTSESAELEMRVIAAKALGYDGC